MEGLAPEGVNGNRGGFAGFNSQLVNNWLKHVATSTARSASGGSANSRVKLRTIAKTAEYSEWKTVEVAARAVTLPRVLTVSVNPGLITVEAAICVQQGQLAMLH